MAESNVYPLPVRRIESDPFLSYSICLKESKIPIIIDNGSYQCRAGWANEERPSLVFKNHIAKHRGKKENEVQVGNDIKNIEVVRWLLKTQFDRNVVTQFDVQEVIFDHIFSHFNINTEGCINHPIVITEPLCNPSYSRQDPENVKRCALGKCENCSERMNSCNQTMSELLFECYQVPRVAYGIDSLFSFHCNSKKARGKCGLIISCGFNTTHVLPILQGRMDLKNCMRINVGGFHMIGFFHRFLQIKYGTHLSTITLSRSEDLFHEHMYFSKDYDEDIKNWANEDYYEKHVHKIQLPFTPLPRSFMDTGVGKLEKCHAILGRIQALKFKRRAEKLALDEERLQELLSVQELLDDDDNEAILALQELGYSSASELQAGIKHLNCSIRKMKNIIANQQNIELQESPFKNWCEELNIQNFSDTDMWIAAVHHKRKEMIDMKTKASFEMIKSRGIVETDSFMSPNTSSVLRKHDDSQAFRDLVSEIEERKEHIEVIEEIVAEYNREFSRKFLKASRRSDKNFSFNLAEYYQLHIGVERIRVPEIIFQPSIIGIEQAGLAETLEIVFSRYSQDEQQLLAENVLLTGSCASIPFFKERIKAELLAMRPFRSKFIVHLADNPGLDAWKGAKLWSVSGENIFKHSITRAEYEEKGANYFKEHSCSNYYVNIPSPARKGILAGDVTNSTKVEDSIL